MCAGRCVVGALGTVLGIEECHITCARIAAHAWKVRLRQTLGDTRKRRGQAVGPDAECASWVNARCSETLSGSADTRTLNGLADSDALQRNLNHVDPVNPALPPAVTSAYHCLAGREN